MDKPYVGFWRRVLAAIIDTIMMTAIMAAVIVAVMPLLGVTLFEAGVDAETGIVTWFIALQLLPWAITFVYEGVMQASPLQAYVGKMAVGAIVTDVDGARLGYGRSFLRAICKVPSAITFAIGFLMVAFTPRKQGLHDVMAGTLVVKKRAVQQAFAAGA